MNWIKGYITDMTEEEYAAVYDTLSASRKAHIDRMKHADARRRSLMATRLVNSLLGEGVTLETDDGGRPFLRGSDQFVSISHSNDAVVCAVSTDHVGIDIERIRPIDRKLAEYVCTERELAYVLEKAELQDQRFFEVWTAKEACYKHDSGSTPLRAIETLDRHKQTIITDGYCITIV